MNIMEHWRFHCGDEHEALHLGTHAELHVFVECVPDAVTQDLIETKSLRDRSAQSKEVAANRLDGAILLPVDPIRQGTASPQFLRVRIKGLRYKSRFKRVPQRSNSLLEVRGMTGFSEFLGAMQDGSPAYSRDTASGVLGVSPQNRLCRIRVEHGVIIREEDYLARCLLKTEIPLVAGTLYIGSQESP